LHAQRYENPLNDKAKLENRGKSKFCKTSFLLSDKIGHLFCYRQNLYRIELVIVVEILKAGLDPQYS
jgi:hypothetical protein